MIALILFAIVSTTEPQPCPSGNGTYCGEAVKRDPRFLWLCYEGQWSAIEKCPGKCVLREPGKPDYCDPFIECVPETDQVLK